jgi:ABC-type polysaccharide/polyol phosphate transport system ATPase subunit
MPILTATGLSKRYTVGTSQRRDLWALRDVSFSVEPGQILGIIGPNGAGKTTLLKILARVTPPTEGRVVGRGRVVPLLALGAGFQPDLSGRENVFLNAAMYGISADDVEERMDDIIEFAGIGDLVDMPVKRYSSGMYLRLAFSVAINMKPDILLADEVLAVGDLEFQERCLERVQQEGRAGMSVFFVSHDLAAITRLCDRVLWLNSGRMMRLGDPEQVVAEYQNSAWSLAGRRLQNVKSGTHKSAVGEIVFVTLASADGREIGAAKVTDEVLVKVGVRMNRPGVTARFQIHMFTRGTALFRLKSEDYEIDAAGMYVASLRILPPLFTDNVYSISVEVVVHTGTREQVLAATAKNPLEKSVLSAFNALSFQMFNPATQRDAMGGLIAPPTVWEFQRESAPATARPAASAVE